MRETIRRNMRQKRRDLSIHQQQQAAIELWLQFRTSPLFLHSKRIGLYLANDGEIDPSFIAHNLLSQKRSLFLPCINSLGSNQLSFAPYNQKTLLKPNRFGIPEPSTAPSKQVKPVSLDLALLPLVAFDSSGNRIGMGGGFYDRTFSFKKSTPRKETGNLGPKLVGLAHECQETDNLNAESWDIPLDAVLTNRRFIEIPA